MLEEAGPQLLPQVSEASSATRVDSKPARGVDAQLGESLAGSERAARRLGLASSPSSLTQRGRAPRRRPRSANGPGATRARGARAARLTASRSGARLVLRQRARSKGFAQRALGGLGGLEQRGQERVLRVAAQPTHVGGLGAALELEPKIMRRAARSTQTSRSADAETGPRPRDHWPKHWPRSRRTRLRWRPPKRWPGFRSSPFARSQTQAAALRPTSAC